MTNALVLLTGSLLVAAPLIAPAPPALRTPVDPEGRQTVIFIPATAVLDPSGGFSATLPKRFLEMIADSMGDLHRQPAGLAAVGEAEGCGAGGWGEMSLCEFRGDTTSPQTIVATAKAVVAGRISAVTPGFFHTSPGSLLEVSELSFLKRDDDFDLVSDRLYVRHPFAHFRIGSAEFCSAPFEARTIRPEAGDCILVFAFDRPFDEGGIFVFTWADQLVIEKRGEPLFVPSTLAALRSPQLTMDGLIERLQKLAPDR